MPFHTDRQRKERILIYGAPKSGKTYCWASITNQLLDSGTTIHVIDSDFRATQSLEHVKNWESVINLYQPQNWDELHTMTQAAIEVASPEDWIVFDRITHAWEYVTQYYIEQVMDKKPHQFFLDFKKGGGKGNPLAGAYGENWNIINSLYRDWVMKVIRVRCHVLAVASSKQVDVGNDDANVKKLFGPFGVKPEGQKDLGYQFDSVLLTGFGKTSNDYLLSTVGDTNREKVKDVTVNDFSLDYLVKLAGWKVM